MTTKYNAEFSNGLIQTDLRRLVNQIWKLLPMRENEENWEKQLSSVLIELHGLESMFSGQLNLLILLSKLEGLTYCQDFMLYRLTVFSAISLLTEIANSIDGKS